MTLKAIRLQVLTAIVSSFLLLVIAAGHRSATLEATVSIGVLRLAAATTTARATLASIVAITACSSATSVTTVVQCVQY